ncbi:MAG: hypothetical protein HQL07_06665 [Nitrospirae bacterium]|nr:hypothetical protein [Magnetococcales bacterium]HAT51116.1 hypothetical protein [Alphaproteobacteria bacterium]
MLTHLLRVSAPNFKMTEGCRLLNDRRHINGVFRAIFPLYDKDQCVWDGVYAFDAAYAFDLTGLIWT